MHLHGCVLHILIKLEVHHPVVYHRNMYGGVEETTAGQLVTPPVSECEGHVVLTHCSLNTDVTDTV